ncbi:unnamed protein product [Caenorhabditis brenneri]
MPKRANTNVQSSNGGSSAANNDGRQKLRRLAAAPSNSATPVISTTSLATAARQPATSSGSAALQTSLTRVVRQSTTSSAGATSSAAAIPNRNDRSWPNLPPNCDIIIVARLPWIDSTEALNGQRFGNLNLNTDYPGIPSNKFEAQQAPKAKSRAANKKWSVQAVYKDQNNEWKVSFEGWSPDSIDTYDVTMVDKAYIKRFQLRESFLEEYKNLTDPTCAQQINNWLHLCQDYEDDAHHMFWPCHSITSVCRSRWSHLKNIRLVFILKFFVYHSSFSDEYPKQSLQFPVFLLVSSGRKCGDVLSKTSNKTYAELKSLGMNGRKHPVQRICENWKNCKCDARYSALYAASAARNARFLQNGTIDIKSFKTDKDRVIIECSDKCGCLMSCPRRPLQREQQKSVAVLYEEGHMGFGVRAMQKIDMGELIMEYTGHLFDPETKDDTFLDTKNGTYDVSCSVIDPKRFVIDAEHIGNAARFINHRCTPIDTRSHWNEKDLLIPRISIHALENIDIGESIFQRYWAEGEKDGKDIDCDCQTSDCIKLLLTRKT